MNKFNYNNIVTAKPGSPKELCPGKRAWVVAVTEEKDRKGLYLEKFPKGTVYLIEFEDGSSIEAAESDLIVIEGE